MCSLFSHLTSPPFQADSATGRAVQELAETLPAKGRVCYPRDKAFKVEIKSYWSRALQDATPACIVFPESARDVSAAVQVLRRHPQVKFAVKSGGHDPNPGDATSDGGVLISFARMVGATYVEGEQAALVRPGGQWNRVIKDLEAHGVTIVGGRLGCVGVGGYLVQGGLSFLSAQYGMAADNIIGWETVKPDGTIVNVDAQTQPELAKAMRGSGNQFGIVTQFKVKTHRIGKVWGGMRVFTKSQSSTLISILHKFTPANELDPRAALIYSDLVTVAGNMTIMHLFYDNPEPPTVGPFAELLKVPSVFSTTKTRKYSDLLAANGSIAEMMPSSGRKSFRSITLPYVPSNTAMYHEISAKWTELCSAHIRSSLVKAGAATSCTVTFQPFPTAIGRRSEAAGGNAMGLSASDPNRLILELQCMWFDPRDDPVLRRISHDMTTWLEARRPAWLAEAAAADGIGAGAGAGAMEEEEVLHIIESLEGGKGWLGARGDDGGRAGYMPFFMNDATSDQEVTKSYREYKHLKALQEEVDPEGMFRTRLGGFKY